MKIWKLWSLCLFLAIGMACTDNGGITVDKPETGETLLKCEGIADGTPCENGTGTCREGACQPNTEPVICTAAQIVCGTDCCDNATEFCDPNTTCQPLSSVTCQNGTTVCGTDCCDDATQACDANHTCVPVVVCTPETDDAFCARLAADEGLECGEITADDNCSAERTVDCGTTACASGQCNLDNTCVPVVICTPETDDAFCARLAADEGLECGEITADDNCGAERTVDCDTTACASGQCNLDNTCVPVVVCTPETDDAFCARLAADEGLECGEITADD
ncbi:MAG: hypothetical protein FWD46_09070, partial [Cystobacterineae bacterium]|nr:hypothetical protein [Cystobacterineae bacterium]